MTDTEKYNLLRELAEELGIILAIWSISDVIAVRDDLTDEQAAEVLAAVDKKHDANLGINWDVLETTAGFMFPAPEKDKSS